MVSINDQINKIICGDGYEIISQYPDNCFDAIVTDPPFGINFDYKNGKKDVASNPENYWKWFKPFYDQFLRIIKSGGFIAIWQPNLYHRYFWDWYGDDIRIYAGCKNFVQLRKTPINFGYDPIVMKYSDWNNPLRPKKPKRNLDFFVSNTAKAVLDTKSLARKHPCPRQLDQTLEIISNFVIEDGLILDCFIGSGTTALACIQSQRRFIGIEKEKEFCDLSELRISQWFQSTI